MKKIAALCGVFSILALSSAAYAVTPENFYPGMILPGMKTLKKSSTLHPNVLEYGDPADYQIGSEFGKHAVTPQELAQASAEFQRTAKATAHVAGATGFFLGKFNGELVMATNHHVVPKPLLCRGKSVEFKQLGIRTECERALGSWPEIDLALFTIRVEDPKKREALLAVARNFSYEVPVRKGTALMTLGFGVAANPRDELMANQDSDCRVFSNDSDFRLMGDPDQYNPGDYKAWSFAIGCEVSHGDSGSAIVDRGTGEIIGIVWTGAIPKKGEVQNSRRLKKWFKDNDPRIWEELTFAVPSPKIQTYLLEYVKKHRVPSRDARTIKAVAY